MGFRLEYKGFVVLAGFKSAKKQHHYGAIMLYPVNKRNIGSIKDWLKNNPNINYEPAFVKIYTPRIKDVFLKLLDKMNVGKGQHGQKTVVARHIGKKGSKRGRESD